VRDDDRFAIDVGDVLAVGGGGDGRCAGTEPEQPDEDEALEQPPVASAG